MLLFARWSAETKKLKPLRVQTAFAAFMKDAKYLAENNNKDTKDQNRR